MIKAKINGPTGDFELEINGGFSQIITETGMLISKILVGIESETGVPVNVTGEIIGKGLRRCIERDREEEVAKHDS